MAGVEADSLLLASQVTDRYEVLDKIEGADNVFRARQKSSDLVVALKEVRDATKARFELETNRASLFDNIVKLLDEVHLDGGVVLVLDYLHKEQRVTDHYPVSLVLNPSVLDRYELIEQLKGGRDTFLFKARRRYDIRLVFLKAIPVPAMDSAQVRLEQASCRAFLNDNNIVELLDSFVFEGQGAVLVMKYPDDAQPALYEGEAAPMVFDYRVLSQYDLLKQISKAPIVDDKNVFLARRKRDDRLVLLKEVPDRVSAQHERIQAFVDNRTYGECAITLCQGKEKAVRGKLLDSINLGGRKFVLVLEQL